MAAAGILVQEGCGIVLVVRQAWRAYLFPWYAISHFLPTVCGFWATETAGIAPSKIAMANQRMNGIEGSVKSAASLGHLGSCVEARRARHGHIAG